MKSLNRALPLAAFFAVVASFGCTPPALPEPGEPAPPGIGTYPPESFPASSGVMRNRSRPGNCGGVACTVNIEIDVKAYQPFDPASGRFNVTVAAIRNTSTGTELKYGLKPSTVETYEVKARKGWTGPATIALYRLPVSGGKYFVSEKVLRKCDDRASGVQFTPNVDFAEYKHGGTSPCMTSTAARPPAHFASMIPFARMAALFAQPTSLTGPIWMECEPGCCS